MKLKTRTNQPVYYKLPVSSNIQSMSDDLLNSLRVGDVVQKKTGNQKHCYIVTYKEEKHGICLSYFDGSGYLETVSYDYLNGHWVYNSTDVCQVKNGLELIEWDGERNFTQEEITKLSQMKAYVEYAHSYFISSYYDESTLDLVSVDCYDTDIDYNGIIIQCDSGNASIVSYSARSFGTTLYKHSLSGLPSSNSADIYSLKAEPFTSVDDMYLNFLFGKCGIRYQSGELGSVIEYIVPSGSSPKIVYHNNSGTSSNISLTDYVINDTVTPL